MYGDKIERLSGGSRAPLNDFFKNLRPWKSYATSLVKWRSLVTK